MIPPFPLSSDASRKPVAWSVAGFDPSSGAGVTADLLTFAAHGIFGCSALTALTVQTTLGVAAVHPVSAAILEATLESLSEDLLPAGIKIGMIGSAENVEVLAKFLASLALRPESRTPVVLDPVLRSSSGRDVLPPSAVERLRTSLLPRVDWVTPNWKELAALTGGGVETMQEAEAAARRLGSWYPGLNVIATGGDLAQPTDLLLLADGSLHSLTSEHVETRSTHGTGCAFSSALLSQLVLGRRPLAAAQGAQAFVQGALRHAPGLGKGAGPLGLLWPLQASRANDPAPVPAWYPERHAGTIDADPERP